MKNKTKGAIIAAAAIRGSGRAAARRSPALPAAGATTTAREATRRSQGSPWIAPAPQRSRQPASPAARSPPEVSDEESYYEVEVTRADGSQVDVQLDRGFNVVDQQADHEDAGEPAGTDG